LCITFISLLSAHLDISIAFIIFLNSRSPRLLYRHTRKPSVGRPPEELEEFRMRSRLWLLYAIVTTTFWGVWGAFIEAPERAGFPATLGYSVWALTMIPPALVALRLAGWRLDRDRRSILLGSAAGLLGAGGQLVLFHALTEGPAYIVFPLISLSPVVTILMSLVLLREKASLRGWFGIALAVVAVPLLSYQPPDNGVVQGYLWLVLALGVFLAWGIQAYVIKVANQTMSAES